MIQPGSKHICILFSAAILAIVLGCGLFNPSTPDEQVATPTVPHTVVLPSPQTFPLTGSWSGYARNGTFEMEVSISIGIRMQDRYGMRLLRPENHPMFRVIYIIR